MSSFDVLSSDVSMLPQAPNLTFVIDRDGEFMRAKHEGWVITCKELEEDGRHAITISLDGAIYCGCEYIETDSPHFPGEDATSQVSHFAAGLFWSAWRRMQLKNGSTGR